MNPQISSPRSERLAAVRRSKQALENALHRRSEIDLARLGFPLKLNHWTLARDTLQLLVALVNEMAPRHVVEFGSGLSTRTLSRAASGLSCRITSIDHDPEFLEKTRWQLRAHEESAEVCMYLGPLVVRHCAGQALPMYALDHGCAAGELPADLVLIDGPPAALGGRAGMLFQAMNFARSGTIVLLDDANRPAERQALELWQETFRGAIEVRLLTEFAKGLAAVIVHDPIRADALEGYRCRLAAEDLAAVIQPNANCLILDEAQWNLAEVLPRARAVRFGAEQGGAPPADAASLLTELDRSKARGVDFVVVGWPAFWWLEYYASFGRSLRSQTKSVLENSRVAVFALQ